MAEKTQQVDHPYPSKREDPHYDRLEDFFESVDAEDFAARDQWNISVVPKGKVSVSVGGVVSWNKDIVINHGSSGRRGIIDANPGGLSMSDGDIAWVEVVRGPQGQYHRNLTLSGGDVPNSERALAIFWRIGDLVWARQMGAIALGQSFNPSSAGAVAQGEVLRNPRRLAGRNTVGVGREVIGRYTFSGDRYERDRSSSYTIEFAVEARVVIDGESGEVALWDDDAQKDIKVFTFTSDQPTRKSSTVTLDDPSVMRPYEVQAGMASGMNGELEVYDANIEFQNQF